MVTVRLADGASFPVSFDDAAAQSKKTCDTVRDKENFVGFLSLVWQVGIYRTPPYSIKFYRVIL